MSKNKNLSESIFKLKNQFESGNNLIDYFLVCGCDPSIIFSEKNLFNITSDKTANLNNLANIIKLKMLTKFPEFDNENDNIDDEILSYCFPFGFKPYYNDIEIMKEKTFSIILDNNLFSSDYPQKYLTCLLFYESLEQYKNLYDELSEINSFNNKKENQDNNQQNNDDEDQNPNEKIIHSSIYINNESQKNIERTYTKAQQEDKALNKISKITQYKYYYIPKCICIVSIHPNIRLFQEILISIYNYSQLYQKIPIEKIITNLLIEVPIAPRGLYEIEFNLINKKKILGQTENNKLLITEIDLKKFNNNIPLDIQIEVLKHLIYGTKVIIFSKNLNNLTEAILAFLFLIFPFKYPFQVTSCLNENSYNILESVSPFFVGINETYNSDFFNKNEIFIEGMDILIVDLDRKKSELLSNEIFPQFPSKLISNLLKEIQGIEKKYVNEEDNEEIKEEKKSGGEISVEEFNTAYQNSFFIFMCELIKNYEDYLNMNYFKKTKDVFTSIETLFNCEDFIKYHLTSELPFYNKFVKDSQLFADFIYFIKE